LEFQAVGCGTSDIQFSGPPTPGIEVLNGSFTNVSLNPENATATVSGGGCGTATPETTFSITNTTLNVGEDGCVEIEVEDFENITDVALSITYNSSQLNFSSVGGFGLTGLDANDFNTATPGVITLDWSNASGVSLIDGAAIFELCFTGIQSGTANLAFSDNPVAIAVTNGDGESVDFIGQNGAIIVQDVDVTLDLTNTTIDVGQTGCVDVRVSDFDNIGNLQLTINYNSTLLDFSSVTGISLPGLQASDFNTSTPGVITVNWSNGSGVTEPDGTTIFELCFTGSAAGTASLSFGGASSAATGGGTPIDFNGQGGNIIVNSVNTDLTLTVEDATVNQGDNVCLELEIDNFEGIIGMSFTISYDASQLSYSGATNLNSNLPGFSVAGNVANPNPGFITVNWFENSLTPITLPDGSILLEVCFNAIGSGSTDVEITSDVAVIEFSDINENIIPLVANDGTVTINGGPPPTGDLTLTVEDATVNQGDNVCLELEIDNFEDLIGMSFTVSYDASQLTYTGATNLNSNLTGFSVAGNVANPSPGFITVNWFEGSLTPITLPNGSVLLEICFDANGSGSTDVEITSDVAAIEFSDLNENVIPLTAVDGTVTINGGPPPTDDLTLTVEDATVNQGDNVCLELEIDNFEGIIGMSFTVSYDASQLSYTGVTNLNSNLPGFSVAGNVANPSPGFITINWFENSLTPITLPNGSVILEVCFDAIGSGTTDVEITSDVAAIEFSDINENIIPLTANDGTVTINGGPPSDDLTISVGNASANQGETVCVPVTVDNFTDLIGMSFTISYDESLLTFTNVQDLTGALPGFSQAGNIGTPGPGQVTVNWFENSLTPTSLPDGTILFLVCFEALGGGSAAVNITSEVAAIEFSDANENVIPPVINNGTITIFGDPTPDGLLLTIDDQTVDPGDQFCTSVKAFNFEGVVGMSFTISYNPMIFTLDDITNLTTNLPGFTEAGNIGTPSPGFVTVNWFENSLTPTSLPNGEVLFDICFTATGSGITSDIEFTSDVAAIEFSDANEDVIPFDSDPGTITITGTTTDLTLTAASIDVEPAESFCVPISIQNFEDIVGMSFTLNYDAAHLSFDQVTNLTTNLPGFTVAGNIGNPSNGFITVNWFENSLTPTTLPDDEVLFEVCFTALGVDGSCSDIEFTSDIAAVEFSDANENVIPAFFEDGSVCIEDSVPGQVQLEVGDSSLDLDASVCVPVSVEAFANITDFGFTLEYDANELQLDNLDDITSMLPNFTAANIDISNPGIVAVSWSGGAVTLADGTVLFDLCFTAIGTEDTCSDIIITSSDEPISFTSSTLGELSFSGEEGTICINSAFDGFRLSIPDQTVQPGEQVCVPVTVLNFLDVVGFAFTINYDETQLSFQNINNLNPAIPDFSVAGNFGVPSQIGAGNVSVNWFSQSITPVNLTNGAALFEICFTVIGDDGDVSTISFSSDVTPIEISDSNGDIIQFNSLPGTITVSAVQPPNIATADVTDVDCFGETTGAIDLTVNGGTGGPYSYEWSNDATTASLSGLGAGTYTVTVTDMGSGGLTATATYTVDGPSSAVAISGGVTAPTCANGTNGAINLNISGGNPSYTISWDSGIQAGQTNPSNLPGGTYCVTVTDESGCTAENCYNVPNGTGSGATINETITDESCAGENDGSIVLSVSGAVGTANYFWSTAPGIPGPSTQNNLSPGNYSVTILDDASCQSTASFVVEEATPINIFEGVTDVSCTGEATGVINLAVSGGNGGFN
ncbi:MAG: hypothetical protein HRU12_14475, partial [Phaeodactylibacter sp.]|nr:hypothetical protein [Phaeodactylibacter sp.]